MLDHVIETLNAVYPICEDLRKRLLGVLVHEEIKKSKRILSKGDVCENVYFIMKGLMRGFCFAGTKDVTLWLMKEGEVVIAVDSFFNQSPSKQYMEALEETEVVYISFDSMEKLCDEFPSFAKIRQRLTEKYYALLEDLSIMKAYDVEGRYKNYKKAFPEMFTRAPKKYIASLLGVSEYEFSRVKNALP